MSTTAKQIRPEELAGHFRDGMSIMVGGFLGCGTPHRIIDLLLDSGVRDLTIINNDSGFPDIGVGRLVANRRVKKFIASHIGTNPLTGQQMMANEMEVELVPQGTLAERIRAGGAGLGGVLTPTGVGTIVEEGKAKMTLDGRDYLLERALRADLALLAAQQADAIGNLVYERAARNFNPLMALAADYVVAEVGQIVPAGTIDPDTVMTPGALVDALMLQ